ncbi:MAG: ATP synthase subunit I [Bacillota bacterium]
MALSGEFDRFAGRVIREAVWILVVLMIMLLFRPHNPLIASFASGLGISIINAFFLSLRMRRMLYLLPYGQDRARVFVQMGTMTRWILVIVALYYMAKTGWFILPAVLAGLLTVPAFSVAEAIRALVHDRLQVGA